MMKRNFKDMINDDNIQNLSSTEAINKLKNLVDHNSICMFTTQLTTLPLTARPMSVQKVCDQGNFWFLSAADSNKNSGIAINSSVQLFFSNTSNSEYLSVFGRASITTDRNKIEELWTPFAKAWFTEGKDDPRISIIKVTPEESYYWDTKDGKVVSKIKILASAVLGKTLPEGVEGQLVVKA